MQYANIFYFKKISKIGGTEQFLYEIAKKYKDYDITIFYDFADTNQLRRLRKLVRCKKRIAGEMIKCHKAFFNFNIDMIKDVEAEEYYFVSHANYEELHRVHGGYVPPIKNEKLTHYIGVSQFAADKLNEYAKEIGSKIRAIRCYNPLTLEPKEKVIHLVSAGRLDDKVKGGERTLKLIEALDQYCERNNRHYIWTIFSNPINFEIPSKNVVLMKPRVDVRPYIADADYVLQLSNDMETYCYTINEALGYGVPIITTPLSILKELNISDNEHIVLNWDCANAEEVAREIFEKEVKPFKYKLLEDDWLKFLDLTKTTYKEGKIMKKIKFLVTVKDKYTGNEYLANKEYTFDDLRAEEILSAKQNNGKPYAEEIKSEEKIVEVAKKDPKTEKAIKKTAKKAK